MSDKGILEINDILNEYSNDIQEGITREAESVAKEAVSELKVTSPIRTGKYRKGWRVKTTKGRGFVECIVHNSTNYQLTHLLEKPHLKRNGGITTPKVHIKPVEEKSKKEYEQKVENIIKNGG
ncbi:MAG: HK97 gp10 family phage protein [Bacilli bacterium]|nr:HK97 gp10 family phage protein [Bacilli bacterium]